MDYPKERVAVIPLEEYDRLKEKADAFDKGDKITVCQFWNGFGSMCSLSASRIEIKTKDEALLEVKAFVDDKDKMISVMQGKIDELHTRLEQTATPQPEVSTWGLAARLSILFTGKA